MAGEPGQLGRTLGLWEGFADSLERNARTVAAIILLLIFVTAWGQSSRKFLWYDELVTLKTASMPHWSDTWAFYANGLDTTGPVQSLVARVGLMLPIGPELGSRLPFTFAYLVMCLCVYRFVHRRYPAGFALATMIYFLNSAIFTFATVARSYALVLAGASIAMFSWQSVMLNRRRALSVAGLWFGLAFAFVAHPFAIFLFIPFALAQLLHDLRRRKLDWAIWISLISFPAAYLPLLHGELMATTRFHTNFTSQPNFRSILTPYPEFFFSWQTLPVVLLLTATLGFLAVRQGWTSPSGEETRGFSSSEWVLVYLLALLPFYVGPASFLFGVFAPRYVTCCMIGLVILSVAAVAQITQRSRYAGAVLFVLFLLVATHHRLNSFAVGLHALAHPGRIHQELQARYNSQPWMKLLEESELPLVADCHMAYDPIDFYADSGVKHRLMAVTNFRNLSEYPNTTTGQIIFLDASKELSYRTSDISDFLKAHRHFLLIGGFPEHVWMPRYLSAEQSLGNASVSCLGPDCADFGITIYDVQFGKGRMGAE